MEYNIPIREMAIGGRYEGFYILNDPNPKVSTNGKPFLSAKIADKTGSIELKVWDYESPFRSEDSGCIIKIRGNVSDYKGKLQFTAEQIRAVQDGDIYNLANLVPAAPIDVKKTLDDVKRYLESIKDPALRDVCFYVFTMDIDRLSTCPAAKSVHHAFVNGLLMHTYTMLKLADFVYLVYPEQLDRDLLIAGTFLHDVGKMDEFDLTPLGLVKEYSFEGQLIGHLVMGANRVAKICEDCGVDYETSVLLQHMLLSHHGQLEWGAAVVPKTIEAEVLHLVDKIDATMETYREQFENMKPGEFSENIFSLGKRIYRHKTPSRNGKGK